MADNGNKRKGTPSAGAGDGQHKRKKGGNAGRWQTPSQRLKKAKEVQRGTIEVGDTGIWATCARGMEGKAARELQLLFEEYAEKMYGIKPPGYDSDDESQSEDIEASIQKELGTLRPCGDQTAERVFVPVRLSMDCLLFTKTKPPIEPVEFVRRICQDAKVQGQNAPAKARYLNRLTPVSNVVKATEAGLEEAVRKTLPETFLLREGNGHATESEGRRFFTYGIRPTTRSHNTLDRDTIIKTIANMIDERHKVNLGAPDKIIMVEIFQAVCGMSVVEGNDWEALRKYNLTEIYNQSRKDHSSSKQAGAAKKPSKDGVEEAS